MLNMLIRIKALAIERMGFQSTVITTRTLQDTQKQDCNIRKILQFLFFFRNDKY